MNDGRLPSFGAGEELPHARRWLTWTFQLSNGLSCEQGNAPAIGNRALNLAEKRGPIIRRISKRGLTLTPSGPVLES